MGLKRQLCDHPLMSVTPEEYIVYWSSHQRSISFTGRHTRGVYRLLVVTPEEYIVYWPSHQRSISFTGRHTRGVYRLLAVTPEEYIVYWPSHQRSISFTGRHTRGVYRLLAVTPKEYIVYWPSHQRSARARQWRPKARPRVKFRLSLGKGRIGVAVAEMCQVQNEHLHCTPECTGTKEKTH
jgi:hypothetical protein